MRRYRHYNYVCSMKHTNNIYRPTDMQVQKVIAAGLFLELNAHNCNVENFDSLTESEKIDAAKFAQILFEMENLENIWDFAVYC